jgi:cytochrome P450
LALLKQNWVTFIDPPLHTKIREFINKTFTTKLVYNFKPRIVSISNCLIDCFEDEGEFEMKSDFSYPMAELVIAELLGIPPEERNSQGVKNNSLFLKEKVGWKKISENRENKLQKKESKIES